MLGLSAFAGSVKNKKSLIGTIKTFRHPKSNFTLIYTHKKKIAGAEVGWVLSSKAPDGYSQKVSEGRLFVLPDDQPNWSPDGLFLAGYVWAGERQSCIFISLADGEAVDFHTPTGKSATCDNSLDEWKDGADHTLKISIGHKKSDYAVPELIESK